jgi:hypothetical protein
LKRAVAAALFVAGIGALGGIAWWLLASDARDDAVRRPAASAPTREAAPLAAESATAAEATAVVTVSNVPGFEDPAPLEVDVAPGQIARVVFALTTPR